jgi:hypothetical protein
MQRTLNSQNRERYPSRPPIKTNDQIEHVELITIPLPIVLEIVKEYIEAKYNLTGGEIFLRKQKGPTPATGYMKLNEPELYDLKYRTVATQADIHKDLSELLERKLEIDL